MNHTEEMKRVSKLSGDSLIYIIQDCHAAMEANPENPKNGDYADIAHYCGMELQKRKAA